MRRRYRINVVIIVIAVIVSVFSIAASKRLPGARPIIDAGGYPSIQAATASLIKDNLEDE